MKVSIVGAGIIGLCSAYYLNKAGFEVEVIDKTNLSDGCSFGNAGMIVPSHFIPLATPGIITKGIRWMFNAKSPFYIKPRLSFELAQWLWQFYRACSKEKVEKAIPALKDFSLWSKQLYRELSEEPGLNFQYQEEGLLMLFKKHKTQQEEIATAEKANAIGIEAKVLTAEELKHYETGAETNVLGGVLYPGDAHLYPNRLMEQLISHLKSSGVQFYSQTEVRGFDYQNGKIESIKTRSGNDIPVDRLLIAGGSWTAKILHFLNIKMLLQDGKGYSVSLEKQTERPKIPSILTEAKVAMTPIGDSLRIGGTLEISHLSPSINMNRLKGILEAVPHYYPNLKPELPPIEKVWHGFRPCTPDGLPYIGQSAKFDNLWIATGHAMMGLSLAPATGQLVLQLLQGQQPDLDIDLFRPDRF